MDSLVSFYHLMKNLCQSFSKSSKKTEKEEHGQTHFMRLHPNMKDKKTLPEKKATDQYP